jgi:hypothetical protein
MWTGDLYCLVMRGGFVIPAECVPLNGSVLGTAKGTWVIHVEEAVRVEGTATVLLNMSLRRGVRNPEDAVVTRRVGLMVPSTVLEEFRLREAVACDIRGWLEGTDGDGFLDLRTRYQEAV